MRTTHRVVLYLAMAEADADIATVIRSTLQVLDKCHGVKAGSVYWRDLQGTSAPGESMEEVQVVGEAETSSGP